MTYLPIYCAANNMLMIIKSILMNKSGKYCKQIKKQK